MSTRMHMPSLGGATQWINSAPLRPDDLRGHVVLVDFWTFTCINWLRTEPYIRAWSRAYRNDGLIVIGVHTPEFSFEHEIDRVRLATKERAIDHPVAVDNDYEIWRAFDNHYWPALYFVDSDGVIRDQHFGEGRYDQSEHLIQQLLGVERDLQCRRARRGSGGRLEQPADSGDVSGLRTHGAVRVAGRCRLDQRRRYRLPDRLRFGHWALDGEWTFGRERVVLDQPGGGIVYRFHARDAHLVLLSGAGGPIPFQVLLDGEQPGSSAGVDVDEEGNGTLLEGRLYQLVRIRDAVRERTLQITFLEPGAEAYVFTFG